MWSQDLRQALDYRGWGRLRERDSIYAAIACHHHADADLRITHALELCLINLQPHVIPDQLCFGLSLIP